MVFGGDVDETSDSVKLFLEEAVKDFLYIESKVFFVSVDGVDYPVEFKMCEVPNDMKMLCFLGGELSNSAKYFTTFGDVNSDNHLDVKNKFGIDWKPFTYDRREDGKLAQKKWLEIESSSPNVKYATKRSKHTKYISATLKSRQERVPLIGPFISTAKADPFNLKNNICKEYFIQFWSVIYTER